MNLEIPCWQSILIIITEDNNPSELAKRSHITYSHVSKIISSCKKRGYVKTKKVGRLKKINLTVKGRTIQNHLKKAIMHDPDSFKFQHQAMKIQVKEALTLD